MKRYILNLFVFICAFLSILQTKAQSYSASSGFLGKRFILGIEAADILIRNNYRLVLGYTEKNHVYQVELGVTSGSTDVSNIELVTSANYDSYIGKVNNSINGFNLRAIYKLYRGNSVRMSGAPVGLFVGFTIEAGFNKFSQRFFDFPFTASQTFSSVNTRFGTNLGKAFLIGDNFIIEPSMFFGVGYTRNSNKDFNSSVPAYSYDDYKGGYTFSAFQKYFEYGNTSSSDYLFFNFSPQLKLLYLF
jgi:hypothetical protein